MFATCPGVHLRVVTVSALTLLRLATEGQGLLLEHQGTQPILMIMRRDHAVRHLMIMRQSVAALQPPFKCKHRARYAVDDSLTLGCQQTNKTQWSRPKDFSEK